VFLFLALFLFIAFAGMDWVTRIQKTLLILLIFAQFDMLIGSFVNTDFGTMYVDQIKDGYKNVNGDQRGAYGYTGWSIETAKTNLWDQYTAGPMNSNKEAKSSFMEVCLKSSLLLSSSISIEAFFPQMSKLHISFFFFSGIWSVLHCCDWHCRWR
jgi:hypothetical protein